MKCTYHVEDLGDTKWVRVWIAFEKWHLSAAQCRREMHHQQKRVRTSTGAEVHHALKVITKMNILFKCSVKQSMICHRKSLKLQMKKENLAMVWAYIKRERENPSCIKIFFSLDKSNDFSYKQGLWGYVVVFVCLAAAYKWSARGRKYAYLQRIQCADTVVNTTVINSGLLQK